MHHARARPQRKPRRIFTGSRLERCLHWEFIHPWARVVLGNSIRKPPLGPLRFANPVPLSGSPHDRTNATSYGPGCSQLPSVALYNGLSKDCLTLNIIRPAGLPCDAALPVILWIHGGGNANGQSIFHNGTALVQHSMTVDHPTIYVGINYRLNGFGFLDSPAVQEAGTSDLGLKDQYLALQWVYENFRDFGGDPPESDNLWCVGGCGGLLGAAALRSQTRRERQVFQMHDHAVRRPGLSSIPAAPADGEQAYESLLADVGCAGQGLEGLRAVPHRRISPILVNESVTNFALDDDWFDDDLNHLLQSGHFAALPIIHGSNLDEGGFFVRDVFDFPRRTALIETVASYINHNTQPATHLVDLYAPRSAKASARTPPPRAPIGSP